MFKQLLFCLSLSLFCALPIHGQVIEESKLIANDVDEIDQFGVSVSLSGDRALVGAPNDEDEIGGGVFGFAYVFEYNTATEEWEETARFTSSDAEAGDAFGSSVSLSGNRALVGAQGGDTNTVSESGAAYIFEYNTTTEQWDEIAKLTASDAITNSQFGYSVSLSGNRAIVGGYEGGNAGSVPDAGAAYIFEYNTTTGQWDETAKLVSSDASPVDWFGFTVSISGDQALVGALFNDAGGLADAGAAYVYKYNTTTEDWDEVDKLIASDATASDFFGYAVSLSGDRALVGSLDDENGISSSGAAYVFERNTTTGQWDETVKLTASDAAASDLFSITLSLSDDRALIGAIQVDAGGIADAGAAYAFEYNEATMQWDEIAKLTASNAAASDLFGFSVSLDADRVLVSARDADEGGNNSGAAYIYNGVFATDSDEDGYTDDEEIACGTDPNDAASFPAGTVSGNITADGGFLAGIAVKALDADDPAIVLGTGVTDASGNYDITGVAQGDIVVMVVEPLGFSAQANDLLASVVCNTTTAGIDFTLDGLTLVNDIRTASYWKNELDIAASGGNSAEDFATIIAEIQTRFTDPYFNTIFAGADDVNDWLDIFSKRPGTLTDRAKIELAALVMNVMSMKVSQFEVVTDDGFTVADVITAAAMLLEDGDPSNDNAAKLWAEQVNRGMTIAAGQIGAGNIAYEHNDTSMDMKLIDSSNTAAIPEAFELNGNYPNPFNPETTIRFAVSESAHVTLRVYDTLGRVIATLVDGIQDAGYHEVSFEASRLPSGTYLYRMESPAGAVSNTMLLLK